MIELSQNIGFHLSGVMVCLFCFMCNVICCVFCPLPFCVLNYFAGLYCLYEFRYHLKLTMKEIRISND